MDKVIIDKVDVSECKYYDDGTCCDKDVMSLDCENTDCIYKQLQRAKAENEELQGKYNGLNANYNSLKFENERLKKEVKCYEMSFVANLDRRLADRNLELNEENEKYKQALQEIRDMATLFHSVNEDKGLDRFKNNILDKINEVIGVE